jgi:hypothetical protein
MLPGHTYPGEPSSGHAMLTDCSYVQCRGAWPASNLVTAVHSHILITCYFQSVIL